MISKQVSYSGFGCIPPDQMYWHPLSVSALLTSSRAPFLSIDPPPKVQRTFDPDGRNFLRCSTTATSPNPTCVVLL
ncbi:hypothetical protein TVAG_212350 [Trichomonas vaginalis G3]|uniref:Uncharacterized protein n=1 Tax=Trichomonas vaginalis (strain ATCC PRA-98 / G3) TaxID=412133 RepID=A2E2M5_TRIV3|nr:hypothetical protein TVAGG3_0166130 [Trichomonas vaginalis G3]EAY13053.1 hypothetical protein TVAG_212350 [Trichomonas vaginalis G3]KAI5548241.1 hypothetical protein TVAGG3_0166130 [Trichomonas vaginalis G3]|eukprot:XP_001325276.1 hypothetical protein [Trichomonas vaginalis G3]